MRLRRRLLSRAIVGLLAAPVAAVAQPAAKVHRIGWLSPAAGVPPALRDALRELGWVEGDKFVFEVRQAGDRPERLAALAADLLRADVDLIVASSPSAIRAAKDATTRTPIVMSWWGGPDPVQSGVIASFARPGGNVTGVHMMAHALNAKRLELLHELMPAARRIAVLVHGHSRFEPHLPPLREVARSAGIELQLVDTVALGGYARAFGAAVKSGAQAVLVMASPDFNRDRKLIIEQAARHRLAASYEWGDAAREGGLIGYGASYLSLSRLSAKFIDRILKGADPGEMPVEQPTQFELVINLKTAQALGLTPAHSLLLRANEVIQ